MDDILQRMKARPGDKLVEMSCATCEFNFDVVCASHGIRKDNGEDTYGMPIDEAKRMFPEGCDEYNISFEAFVKQEKLNGR